MKMSSHTHAVRLALIHASIRSSWCIIQYILNSRTSRTRPFFFCFSETSLLFSRNFPANPFKPLASLLKNTFYTPSFTPLMLNSSHHEGRGNGLSSILWNFPLNISETKHWKSSVTSRLFIRHAARPLLVISFVWSQIQYVNTDVFMFRFQLESSGWWRVRACWSSFSL